MTRPECRGGSPAAAAQSWGGYVVSAAFADPAKAFATDFVARNDQAFITLNNSIFYFGELGVQETRTAGLMTSILERHGFEVQRGISGFATSFLATYGHGEPVIAIHTEYDANPSNSQKPASPSAPRSFRMRRAIAKVTTPMPP